MASCVRTYGLSLHSTVAKLDLHSFISLASSLAIASCLRTYGCCGCASSTLPVFLKLSTVVVAAAAAIASCVRTYGY